MFILCLIHNIAINNIRCPNQKEGRRFVSLASGSRTFGKCISIQVAEINRWKRTVVGAPPIYGRKEMAIVKNEPGDVATAGERI